MTRASIKPKHFAIFLSLLILTSCTKKEYITIVQPDVQEPRIIWVPDDYETIQGAIWASEDGDTIMVRAGEYHEQLQFFDKNVSLISESGPEKTIIDGTGYYTCMWVTGGQDTTMLIRGFTFKNVSEFDCYCGVLSGSSPKIVNNIFQSNRLYDQIGLIIGQNAALIRNNLFIYLFSGIDMAHSWGDFSNNMILNITDYGFWNAAGNGQPLIPDYNLFWNYGRLYFAGRSGFRWGENNIIDQEPKFIDGQFRLSDDSPGIDQGRPDLKDIDGTRSDIGVYGGPYAY